MVSLPVLHIFKYTCNEQIYTSKANKVNLKPLDKKCTVKNLFSYFQPKKMLWVLKRTA